MTLHRPNYGTVVAYAYYPCILMESNVSCISKLSLSRLAAYPTFRLRGLLDTKAPVPALKRSFEALCPTLVSIYQKYREGTTCVKLLLISASERS